MDTQKNEMTTLTSVLETLRTRRQDNEFRMNDEGFAAESGKTYQPEELTIVRTYRFEGESDPADSAILYLIEAKDGLIGYSIDTFGPQSNHPEGYDDFIKQIEVKHEDQLSNP